MKQLFTVAFLSLVLLSGCGGGGGDTPPVSHASAENASTIQGIPMPAGFQVIGDHGGIQIDENFYNLRLVQKGRYVIPASFNSNNLVDSIYVMPTTGTPVFVYTPPSDGSLEVLGAGIVQPGTNDAFGNPVPADGRWYLSFNLKTTGSRAFNWYMFERMPTVAAQSGLTVYDAQGNVTFNSDYIPMKIAAITDTAYGAGVIKETFALPNLSKQYALIAAGSRVIANGPGGQTYRQNLFMNNGTYGTDTVPVGIVSGAVDNPYGTRLILVDVTGL